jgi:hypothetical protein
MSAFVAGNPGFEKYQNRPDRQPASTGLASVCRIPDTARKEGPAVFGASKKQLPLAIRV